MSCCFFRRDFIAICIKNIEITDKAAKHRRILRQVVKISISKNWVVSKYINAPIVKEETPIGRRKNEARKISTTIKTNPIIIQKFGSKSQ